MYLDLFAAVENFLLKFTLHRVNVDARIVAETTTKVHHGVVATVLVSDESETRFGFKLVEKVHEKRQTDIVPNHAHIEIGSSQYVGQKIDGIAKGAERQTIDGARRHVR